MTDTLAEVDQPFDLYPEPTTEERIQASLELVDDVLNRLELSGKRVVAVVGLFSGGNDSTTLCHLFRNRVDYFAHANTQVGIEGTRQYVRDTSRSWGRELLEGCPVPGRTYEDLVLGQAYTTSPRAKHPTITRGGFPGQGQHPIFFRALKSEWMNAVRRMLVGNSRRERVVFLGGRRKAESAPRARRLNEGGVVRHDGSAVYVDAIADWTHRDMNDYRKLCGDCPRNEVADQLHMSGECLCGCYAHPGEYDEIKMWHPSMTDYLDDLSDRLRARELDIPEKTLRWGWNSKGNCPTGECNA